MRFVMILLGVISAWLQSDNLMVAYITDAGDLYVWQAGESQLVASGDVSAVTVSPAGDIAYVQGDSLWLVQDDEAHQAMESVNVAQMTWADRYLYFNIYEEGFLAPSGSLFRLDPTTDIVTEVEGGGWINGDVRVMSGDYATGEDGRIIWGDFEWTFEPVATASHFVFYPEVQWQDETTLRVAIPQPDAIYEEVHYLPVALWELTPDSATQIGEIDARFFGLPVWAGDYMAYLRLEDGLYIAQADGTSPQQVFAGDVWSYLWLKDRLVYLTEDGIFTVRYGEEPKLWLEVIPIQMQTVGDGLLFTLMDGLYYAELEGEPLRLTNSIVIVWFGLILLTP